MSYVSVNNGPVQDKMQQLLNYIQGTRGDKYAANGNIEVSDFIMDKNLDFCLGNAVKYICRYAGKVGEKTNNPRDLEKAIHYLFMSLAHRQQTPQSEERDRAPVVKQVKKEQTIEEIEEVIFSNDGDDMDTAPVEVEPGVDAFGQPYIGTEDQNVSDMEIPEPEPDFYLPENEEEASRILAELSKNDPLVSGMHLSVDDGSGPEIDFFEQACELDAIARRNKRRMANLDTKLSARIAKEEELRRSLEESGIVVP